MKTSHIIIYKVYSLYMHAKTIVSNSVNDCLLPIGIPVGTYAVIECIKYVYIDMMIIMYI